MRFNRQTAATSSLTVFAALAGTAAAQNTLPNNKVPNVGGGVYKANDPSLANYTLKYRPPFNAANYGGYYAWGVSNSTVAITNVSEVSPAPDASALFKYPFFTVTEGKPKPINLTASDCDCDSREHARDLTPTRCEGQKFKKILHIMFENEVYGWTMNDSWWKLLASRGKLLTNSHGVTHPSLPNYVSLLAGDFFGIANEDFYNVNATTIYDLLDAIDLDYATYAEWYTPVHTARGPDDCNQAITRGPIDSTNPDWSSQIYRRLDVPALLFSSYTSNYTRCSKIYNATEKFDADVKSHQLPPYSFYVPDMLHNGHDPESDMDYVHQPTSSGIWFNAFLDMYLPELTKQGTLVVATWDEATWQNDADSTPNNDNHIATILFGHGITPDTQDDTYITHYGVLRGAISNFGLGSLGRNDTNATNGDLSMLLR